MNNITIILADVDTNNFHFGSFQLDGKTLSYKKTAKNVHKTLKMELINFVLFEPSGFNPYNVYISPVRMS